MMPEGRKEGGGRGAAKHGEGQTSLVSRGPPAKGRKRLQREGREVPSRAGRGKLSSGRGDMVPGARWGRARRVGLRSTKRRCRRRAEFPLSTSSRAAGEGTTRALGYKRFESSQVEMMRRWVPKTWPLACIGNKARLRAGQVREHRAVPICRTGRQHLLRMDPCTCGILVDI